MKIRTIQRAGFVALFALPLVMDPHPTVADTPDATTALDVVEAAPLTAGHVLRVPVAGAEGAKTVIGQLTVARATDRGYVTAYGCADGLPRDGNGRVSRSDLNYDGQVSPVWSNRLIVKADNAGHVCFYTAGTVELIIDVNAVSFDTGITSFDNRRTDTRLQGPPVAAGQEIRVNVPEAAGRKTVVGQLTAAQVTTAGFVTAYPCDQGIPRNASGVISRSDLNFDPRTSPVRSNRLIAEADADGDVCFHTSERVEMIVDINGVSDSGIDSFTNERTDTRDAARVQRGGVLRVNVPSAIGSKTVVGQLTVARATDIGFVTAYPCDAGPPVDESGRYLRSDVNNDGRTAPVWSNRLIVAADADGDICFYASTSVDLVVDVNAVSGPGITSFPNWRIDTRDGTPPGSTVFPTDPSGAPVWPDFEPLPALTGVAALTGLPTTADVTSRPILAFKVDNYRLARPHFGLTNADAVIEVNVEGVSRFIALFQSRLPATVGPIRSARTGDLDLLAGMNRPVFGYSGANPGTSSWLISAAAAGVLVDFSAEHHGCYVRHDERPGPHNLLVDPVCTLGATPSAGPARPMWSTDASWASSAGLPDATFAVPMDGVVVEWTWDPVSATYLRSQDGSPHVVETGEQLVANNVVEISTPYIPSVVDERSPHAITVGEGDAIVHRDGRAIPATWSRWGPFDAYTFRDATTDEAIPLDVGVTFLELTRDS